MKTYIFLGGPTEDFPHGIFAEVRHARDQQNARVIGVDHGSLVLLRENIVPDISVGDYDSLTESELAQLEANVHDIRYAIPEKDYTDSEMGILTALRDLKSSEVIVIGATGGRLDHFLVNLFCMLKPKLRRFLRQVTMIDQKNIIEFFGPGNHQIAQKKAYKYVAFVNLTAIDDFNILDAKYSLTNFSADYPVSWASNEFVASYINFNFKSGVIAVIYSKD